MIAAVLLGLSMAMWARCAEPAYAEPVLMPAGSTVIPPPLGHVNHVPGHPTVILDETIFGYTRRMNNRANATAAAERRLTKGLAECTRRAVRATRPEPQWRIGLRWFVTGAAVVGAFVLGVAL